MKLIESANFIDDYFDVIVEVVYMGGVVETYTNPSQELMAKIQKQLEIQNLEESKEQNADI
jgi:hypothetical protein